MRPVFAAVVHFLLRKDSAIVGTGLLFAAGLAMIYGDDFTLGIAALAVAAVWGIAAWLVSKELEKYRPLKPAKLKYAHVEKYKRERRTYLFWKFSIPALIVGVWIVSALFVTNKRDSKQQEDVQNNLVPGVSLPPSGNPWDSQFSVTNNSHYKIMDQFACNPRLIVGKYHNTYRGKWTIAHIGTLEANGDADSVQCLTAVRTNDPMICGDVEFQISYSLENQPKVWKVKLFRFVGYLESDNFKWFRKALDYEGSYCSQFEPSN